MNSLLRGQISHSLICSAPWWQTGRWDHYWLPSPPSAIQQDRSRYMFFMWHLQMEQDLMWPYWMYSVVSFVTAHGEVLNHTCLMVHTLNARMNWMVWAISPEVWFRGGLLLMSTLKDVLNFFSFFFAMKGLKVKSPAYQIACQVLLTERLTDGEL